MQPPYIPTQQAKLITFVENFSSLITANPSVYGLLPADAATIASYVTAFTSSYAQSTKQSPATRTPAAITNTNNAQAAALQIIRTYSQQIRNNVGVTSAAKQAIGLTVPSSSRTPIPVPVTSPTLAITGSTPLTFTVSIKDPTAPATRSKKAVGARMWAIFYVLTATNTPPSVPSTNILAIGTKSPTSISFPAGSSGQYATLWCAWVGRAVGTTGGQTFGPVGTPITQIVQ